MTTPWHEVEVDGLTYGFRDRETGERFKRSMKGSAKMRAGYCEVCQEVPLDGANVTLFACGPAAPLIVDVVVAACPGCAANWSGPPAWAQEIIDRNTAAAQQKQG